MNHNNKVSIIHNSLEVLRGRIGIPSPTSSHLTEAAFLSLESTLASRKNFPFFYDLKYLSGTVRKGTLPEVTNTTPNTKLYKITVDNLVETLDLYFSKDEKFDIRSDLMRAMSLPAVGLKINVDDQKTYVLAVQDDSGTKCYISSFLQERKL